MTTQAEWIRRVCFARSIVAGVRERDVTLGLPRLMELVDARKIPATPSMDIYLDKEHAASNEKAVKVATSTSGKAYCCHV